MCAAWNEDIGTHGAWDANLCTTVLVEQTQTVCECAHFGTYTVVAEMTEEPFVKEEEDWVTVVKYTGLIVSLICLLLFCLVIATHL